MVTYYNQRSVAFFSDEVWLVVGSVLARNILAHVQLSYTCIISGWLVFIILSRDVILLSGGLIVKYQTMDKVCLVKAW